MRKRTHVAVSSLSNMLHKSVVVACAGVTLAGSAYIGGLVYHHYFVTLPAREKMQLEEDNKPLSEFDMEDTAKTLKV